MPTKISLNIPDDTRKELAELADFYKLDVKDAILSILTEIGKSRNPIINLGKEYKVPVKLDTLISDILSEATDYSINTKVLDYFKARGLYTINDMEIDLEEASLHFHYMASQDLCITEFSFAVDPGGKALQTCSIIDVKKVEKRALGKLKEVIKNIKTPEGFSELEDYDFTIDDSDDEYWNLVFECEAENLSDFPSLDTISKTVEEIFKKAGTYL